jgi:uncharacterized membrane protein YjjB (DUF3815 family)
MIFYAPPRLYLACAIGGAIGWVVYIGLYQLFGIYALAIFAASFTLTFYARVCGVLQKAPVIVFIITGVFPLVPGAAIYNMAYHLFAGNTDAASSYGLAALIAAGTIALGMLFGYTMPKTFFSKIKILAYR